MPKIITKIWLIPSREDMEDHKEIKAIFFDDDEAGITISTYSYIEEYADLFVKYPTYGLVNCKNHSSGIRLYNRGILIYGAVPLYSWDSKNGKWIENKKLTKYCVI